MKSHLFAELSSPQVGALLTGDRLPVLLLPVGSVEPHGPHAPLATDQLISAGVCRRAAERLAEDSRVRVLILPELPYGVTRYGATFPGAVSVREQTLRAVVVDVCASFSQQGFPHVVVVNNHFEPEHVEALRASVHMVNERHGGKARYVDVLRRANAARLTDEFRSGECHAGAYETSLVLADRPELVDTEMTRDLPRVPVDMVDEIAKGHDDFLAMGMDRAYCGSPADATAVEGQSTFDKLTTMVIETIREIVEENR